MKMLLSFCSSFLIWRQFGCFWAHAAQVSLFAQSLALCEVLFKQAKHKPLSLMIRILSWWGLSLNFRHLVISWSSWRQKTHSAFVTAAFVANTRFDFELNDHPNTKPIIYYTNKINNLCCHTKHLAMTSLLSQFILQQNY